MTDYSLGVPAFSTYGFIVLCFIVFVLFRIINRLAKTLRVFNKSRKTIAKILPLIELTIWIVFVFWVINKFLRDTFIFQILTATVVLIIILLVSWFFLRDYFAGIMLKSENLFERNQLIKVGNVSGKIKKTSLRHLEFETSGGELVKIPYSKISSENIIKQAMQSDRVRYSIKLSASKKTPAYELRENIRKAVYNSPWHLTRKEPLIEFNDGNEKDHFIEVVVFALTPMHADLIGSDLVSKFQK